jgi:hypothetical protein
MAKILKSDIIHTEDDLVALNIIDFGRQNGHPFRGPHRAIHAAFGCASCLTYSVVHMDLTGYPQQPGWPHWEHAGNHVYLGRLYWNAFYSSYKKGSILRFHDAPDFSGRIAYPEYSINFWGDIGTVSTMACIESVRMMKPGDLWISVVSEKTQIILEAGLIHPLLERARQSEMGKMLGYEGSVPLEEKQFIEWLKAHGYDPSWTQKEYQFELRKYLVTHRRSQSDTQEGKPVQLPLFSYKEYLQAMNEGQTQ